MIQIDLEEISTNVTPPKLRSHEWKAILSVFLKPLDTVLEHLYAKAEKVRFETAFNGQIMYLEKLLNIKFNNGGDEIYIEDFLAEMNYVYNEYEDNEETYLYNADEDEEPYYLTNALEQSISFIIYVPVGLITNWLEFRSWVNKYKIRSKTYQIIEY